jgi:hypothetical protein
MRFTSMDWRGASRPAVVRRSRHWSRARVGLAVVAGMLVAIGASAPALASVTVSPDWGWNQFATEAGYLGVVPPGEDWFWGMGVCAGADASETVSEVGVDQVGADGTVLNSVVPSQPGSQGCAQSGTSAIQWRDLEEGAYHYRAWARGTVSGVVSEQATFYVDLTEPVFPSPFSVTGRPSESGKIWVYWDEADDPALADGSDGSGVARYEARLPGGSWLPVQGTGMQIDEPTSPTTIEIRAYDSVGNVSATVSSPITMAPTDPEDSVPLDVTPPQPADDQYDFDAAQAAGTLTQDRQWELDEINGTDDEQPGLASFADGEARLAPESLYPPNGKHDPDIRYRCVGGADTWAPIQASVSGFVIGNCKGDDWVLGYKARVYPANTPIKDYPGSPAEGLGWEAVSPRASAHFDGCGWINILRRLYRGQADPPSDLENRCDEGPVADRRHHANYGFEEYIKRYSGNRIGGGGGDEPNTIEYKGWYIWATNVKANGKKEKAGYKWIPHFANPNKTCDTYANVNPYKSGQHVLASEKTFSIHDESPNIRLRYIARFRANNEDGNPKWWVMLQSVSPTDRFRNWGFVAADCLFSG